MNADIMETQIIFRGILISFIGIPLAHQYGIKYFDNGNSQ